MKAKDILSQSVVSFTKETPILEAIKVLQKENISGAPVTDNKNNILGIISLKDIMKEAENIFNSRKKEIPKNMKVKSVMTEKVLTVNKYHDSLDVFRLMKEKNIHRIPVVKEGTNKLMGIISTTDGYRALLEMVKEKKSVERELNKKKKRYAVGELVNMLGHNIRNPLASIGNAAYYIESVVKTDNKKLKDHFDIIKKEIEVISEILDKQDKVFKTKKLKLEPVDIKNLFRQTVNELKIPDFITVKINTELSRKKYLIDKKLLQKALIEVLENSIQAFSNRGNIELQANEEEGELIIRVKDDGKGIDREIINRVFNVFFSTTERKSGLGLSLAKSIVERHRGTLNLKKNDAGGTTVAIKIPVREKTDS